MAAFVQYACCCTATCCTCYSQDFGTIVVTTIGRRIMVVDLAPAPALIPPILNPRNLIGGDFLTWLFWTGWQIALPRAVDSLPPARPRRPTPLRKPRVRARGHHPGHSPRRAA